MRLKTTIQKSLAIQKHYVTKTACELKKLISSMNFVLKMLGKTEMF